SRVKVVQGDGDEKYGDQDTDGSHSVRSFIDQLREAGATARLMLVRAAAQPWKVPEAESVAEPPPAGSHKDSNPPLGYGELAALAARQPVPKKEELKFKSPDQWRYIGKPAAGFDVTDICAGKAQFGMDVRIDGMLYAAIEHPPVLGGKVKSVDNSAALKVMGVKQTIPIEPFVAPHAFHPLPAIPLIPSTTCTASHARNHYVVRRQRPQAAQGRVGKRRQRFPQFVGLQEAVAGNRAPAGQSHPYDGRPGRRVRERRQGDGGGILRASPCACLDGAAGC